MPTTRILVPCNFTVNDEKALSFVINTFSNREDIRITLFYAYTPVPDLDMASSPVLKQMRDAILSRSAELSEKEAGLQSAKKFLLGNGFSDDQVDYIFKERHKPIADEIIATASSGQYSILVLSRQPGKVSRLFARSVHSRALSVLKDITVCIAA